MRPVVAKQVGVVENPERGHCVVQGGREGCCSFCDKPRRFHAPITRDGARILLGRYRDEVPVFHDFCGFHMAVFGIALPDTFQYPTPPATTRPRR